MRVILKFGLPEGLLIYIKSNLSKVLTDSLNPICGFRNILSLVEVNKNEVVAEQHLEFILSDKISEQ